MAKRAGPARGAMEGAGTLKALLAEAAAALSGGRAAGAERLARVASAKAPGNRTALYLHGLALLAEGRAAEALLPLEAAAAGNPDPAVETNLAIALGQSGRVDEAITRLGRVTGREPPFAPAFQTLGMLLQMHERAREAEPVLRRAVALAPNDAQSWLGLGGVLLERAAPREARVAFARALAEAPGLPDALLGLGRALMDEGDFATAAERLAEVVARTAERADVHLELAYCLQELGRWDDAVTHYRNAVALAPGLYESALTGVSTAARGRFWLKPSAAAKILKDDS